MKKINVVLLVLVLMVSTMILTNPAQANTINISGADKSLTPSKKTAKFSVVPLMATIRLQHGYTPGVPALVTVSYKYWNARIKVSGLGRVRAFDYIRYLTIVPTAVFQAQSCRPTPEVNCNFDDALTNGKHSKSVVFDVSSTNPAQDWSYTSFFRPKAKVYRGKTKTYKMWVTFPRCLPLDQSSTLSPPPSDWPCQPGKMNVSAEFYARGKGLRGHGYVGFNSNNLFINALTQ